MKRYQVENEIILFITENEVLDNNTKVEYIENVFNLSESGLVNLYEQLNEGVASKLANIKNLVVLKHKLGMTGKSAIKAAANRSEKAIGKAMTKANTAIKTTAMKARAVPYGSTSASVGKVSKLGSSAINNVNADVASKTAKLKELYKKGIIDKAQYMAAVDKLNKIKGSKIDSIVKNKKTMIVTMK